MQRGNVGVCVFRLLSFPDPLSGLVRAVDDGGGDAEEVEGRAEAAGGDVALEKK